MRECCWVTQHRKGKEWSYNTYTPYKQWGGMGGSSYLSCIFLPEKALTYGSGERVWEDLAMETAQVTRMSAYLLLRQAEGEASSLPSTFWCWVQAEGCCRAVWRLSWDFSLMPSVCGSISLIPPHNPRHSAGSKQRPWEANPQKWDRGWKFQWSLSFLMFRVYSTGLFLFTHGIDAALNRPNSHILLTSTVPDSSMANVGEDISRTLQKGEVMNCLLTLGDHCTGRLLYKPRLTFLNDGSTHRRRTDWLKEARSLPLRPSLRVFAKENTWTFISLLLSFGMSKLKMGLTFASWCNYQN